MHLFDRILDVDIQVLTKQDVVKLGYREHHHKNHIYEEYDQISSQYTM